MIEREFRGQTFMFKETKTAPALIDEIFSDNYKVFESGLEVLPGDIVLDLGANEGVFSIMMAKLFPDTRVIAYEPVPRTFDVLCENLEVNDAHNVEACQFGVGAPGVTLVEMAVSKDYSGGSTSKCTFVPEDHLKIDAHLVTLDRIFDAHDIGRCKLMKMDIEGMEYEALYYTSVLERVYNTVIEVHMNHKLEFEGRRADGLVNWLSDRTNLLHVEICRMAE